MSFAKPTGKNGTEREDYCAAISKRLTADERSVKKEMKDLSVEGRASREPALSKVEGSSPAGTPGSPPALAHQRGNAGQASHEVPLSGICHGRKILRSSSHATRIVSVSFRTPRSRSRREVAESARCRAFCRPGFADPLPRSATFSARLSSMTSRGSRH